MHAGSASCISLSNPPVLRGCTHECEHRSSNGTHPLPHQPPPSARELLLCTCAFVILARSDMWPLPTCAGIANACAREGVQTLYYVPVISGVPPDTFFSRIISYQDIVVPPVDIFRFCVHACANCHRHRHRYSHWHVRACVRATEDDHALVNTSSTLKDACMQDARLDTRARHAQPASRDRPPLTRRTNVRLQTYHDSMKPSSTSRLVVPTRFPNLCWNLFRFQRVSHLR